jgi:hypothetical protein
LAGLYFAIRMGMMMSSKKIILSLLLLCFSLVSLWASDIKFEGSGSSVTDARTNARNNLSEYINGVFVQATTEAHSYADSETSKNTFSSSSNASSSGYLKAVEYENEHNDKGTYYSTATIKDNKMNISVFKDQLKNSKATIESLYGSLPKQSNEQKKNTLITIYATLTEYEAYRTILIYMGHSDLIPELSINISTTSIYIEYQNIIIEEGYALEEKEKLITDETEHQKLLEELSANRTEQRRLEREKNEAATAREEAAKLALEERLKQYAALTQDTSQTKTSAGEQYSVIRANITTARQNFLDACTQYDKLCKEQFALIDKDYEAEKAAVEARPYRYAELQGSTPTPAAKKVREDEINYLYTLKELHKVAVLKQIRTSMLSSIKARYDEYCACISAIDNKSFELVLGDETINNIATSFDSINVIWTVKLTPKNIEGLVDTTFSFTLSYNQLTGQDPQEPKYRGQQGYDEYMAYLDDIDYLDTIIKTFADSFRISLKFTTCADKADYGIGYNGIDIKNLQFILESNALNNPDWTFVVDASPSHVYKFDLTWTLPGYSRTFNGDLSV